MSYPFEQDKIYCELVKLVINAEGKYVNNPKDPGGATKFGVAYNYNQGILKELGVTDMRALTLDQAKQIYYKKYWLASGANFIPDKRLAYIHFDTAVNQGVGFAAKCVFALSAKPSSYEANGKNEALWFKLLIEYLMLRLKAYNKDRNRKAFLEGWLNRMIHLMDQELQF